MYDVVVHIYKLAENLQPTFSEETLEKLWFIQEKLRNGYLFNTEVKQKYATGAEQN